MKNSSVVRRYAESLFAVSEKLGCTDAVRDDVKLISSAYSAGDLSKVLSAPSILISEKQKKAVLKDLFGARVQKICLNFLYLLIDRNRTNILFGIAEEFENLIYESRNIDLVSVESAYALSEDDLNKLQAALEKHLSKKLIISKVSVNPSLIGGLRVIIGNDVIDGSVAAELTDMKRSLLSL